MSMCGHTYIDPGSKYERWMLIPRNAKPPACSCPAIFGADGLWVGHSGTCYEATTQPRFDSMKELQDIADEWLQTLGASGRSVLR